MITAIVRSESGGAEKVQLECQALDDRTHTATGCEEHAAESHNPIIPEMNELVYSLIAFVILAFLFMKFAYPMVKRTMDERSERIRGDLDSAEASKAQAEQVLDDYKRQLADAKNESNRIIEEARATAERMKDEMVRAAQAEVADLKSRAQADVEAAKEQAVASLQNDVKDLTIQLAEKVVQRSLDRKSADQLIDSFISEVAQS